jgi:anti-sigma factor RsiW
MAMTCDEAAALLDAFVDCELAPSMQLDVACHAGQCAQCETAVQDLLSLREALVASSDTAVAALDLSGIWPAVDARITREAGQDAWRARRNAMARPRVPGRAVTWGVVAAIAASAVLMLRTPQHADLARQTTTAAPVRVAAKRLPNSVYIDRLAGKDIALRREPKSGTTIIWVNHQLEAGGW